MCALDGACSKRHLDEVAFSFCDVSFAEFSLPQEPARVWSLRDVNADDR